MNRERLTRLADFLYDLEPKRFDFGHYISEDWNYQASDINLDDPNTCGTTACAIGYASMLPDMGLDELNLHSLASAIGSSFIINRRVAEAFGLDSVEVEYLFYAGATSGLPVDASPKQVANHIRNFMENYA